MDRAILVVFSLIVFALAGCLGGDDAVDPEGDGEETTQEPGGTLTGQVFDASSLVPVQGANVTLVEDEQAAAGTTTDPDGTYTLSGVSPGLYRIHVTSVSHNSAVRVVEIVDEETVEESFLLEPFPTENPYDQFYDFRGFMTLGKHSPLFRMTCCTNDPNHQTAFNFSVDRPDLLRTIIVEVRWDEAHVGLHAYLWLNPNCDPVCNPDEEYGEGNGFGNLSFRVDHELGKWPGFEQEETSLTVQLWPERDEEVATLAYQQDFEVYVQAFYVEPAPEGLVITPDM